MVIEVEIKKLLPIVKAHHIIYKNFTFFSFLNQELLDGLGPLYAHQRYHRQTFIWMYVGSFLVIIKETAIIVCTQNKLTYLLACSLWNFDQISCMEVDDYEVWKDPTAGL
jgi:hypothetical protein